MTVRRDKLWYLLHDPDGQIAELEVKLDRADIEIDGLQRIRFEENRAGLERIGLDTANYRPPPRRLATEQRCVNHIGPDDDVEAIVTAANESPLDRAYREHLAATSRATADETDGPLLIRPGTGQVLAVR